MIDREKLSSAIGLVAWGYFFIYFNLNLGPIDILPNFVGYMFILNSLDKLAVEERSTILLRPLVYILIAWELLKLINGFVNLSPQGYIFSLINTVVIVVSLYYNFQLFTNLSTIADKYECIQEKSLLVLRTLYTVLITVVSLIGLLPSESDIVQWISLGLNAITLVLVITTSSVLFGLKKSILNNEEQRL